MKAKLGKLIAGISLLLAAGPALAIGTVPYTGQTVASIILHATDVVLNFAGALAVLFIIYAGILYVTSSGDKDRIERAKKTLTYAVIGIIVIVLSKFIVAFIDNNASNVIGLLTVV